MSYLSSVTTMRTGGMRNQRRQAERDLSLAPMWLLRQALQKSKFLWHFTSCVMNEMKSLWGEPELAIMDMQSIPL